MRQRLPAEDRRQQILDVAQRLFAEHGFHAATAREIARAAGVSDALMYLYFRSKQEVFDAIIEQGMRRFAQSTHRQVPSNLPIRSFLLQVGTAFLQLLHRERDLLIILTSLQHDTRWASFVEGLATRLAQQIQERVASGELRAETNGYLLARHFFGDLVGYTLLEDVLEMKTIHTVDAQDYLHFVVDTLLRGILP